MEKKKLILKISERLNMPHRLFVNPNAPERAARLLDLPAVTTTYVEDWLYYIKNCSFFIADSFHGVCFAIIFRVPFVCYINRDEPSKWRFINLLKTCGLSDRLVYTDENIESRIEEIMKPIDYGEVFQRLEPHIDFSKKWLENVLSTPRNNSYSFEEKTDEAFSKLITEISDLKRQLNKTESELNMLSSKVQHMTNHYDPYFSTVTDIREYLTRILKRRRRLIVAIAVRDTAGFFVGDDVNDQLHQIGFGMDLRDKHWYGYAGLCGRRIAQEALEQDGVAMLNVSVRGNHIELVSKAYTKGDIAQILINGMNHAVNKRGLNIVLISAMTLKVVDSVCFDTHTKERACYRLD